jgi:SAM-dependent methyltransferase
MRAQTIPTWDRNPSRARLKAFIESVAAKTPPHALVLDAGAGEQTYAPLFAHARYESADFEQVNKLYIKATYTCDLAQIPVDSHRYDAILCSQVLEHIPDPPLVLAEFHRVLKPGGALWLTAPLFYEEHEQPYDFFRYTQFGLRHILDNAGFSVVSIDPLEGYFATLGYQAKMMRQYLPRTPTAYGGGVEGHLMAFCAYPVAITADICAGILARLEMRHKLAVGLPKNYAVIARRR